MEPTEHNRRAWDEVHRRRSEAMRGELGIPEWVRPHFGDLRGVRVLHLQCATGEATAELVAQSALVTGVDISSEALTLARERAPTAVFLQGDVQALPPQVRRGRFDLVYTGGGVLTWLQDLDAWAGGVVSALGPEGRLVLHDAHPVVGCLDASMRWRESYFDESTEVNVGWDHFELPGAPATEPKQERFWRLGQIVTAVAAAGLRVDRLDEMPSTRHWRTQDPRVPGEFLLLAKR